MGSLFLTLPCSSNPCPPRLLRDLVDDLEPGILEGVVAVDKVVEVGAGGALGRWQQSRRRHCGAATGDLEVDNEEEGLEGCNTPNLVHAREPNWYVTCPG